MGDENRIYLAVISYIKQEFRAGRFQAGSKLPAERDMANILHVSRNSVREALRTLENMGILECRRGSGNYLQGNISQGLSEALSMHLMLGMVERKEAIQIQRSIEIGSFIGIIEREIPCNLQEMRELVQRIDDGKEEAASADRKFHQNIVRLNQNDIFSCLEDSINKAYEEEIFYRFSDVRRQELNQCHRLLLEAIETKDQTKGLSAIVRHYQIAEKTLFESSRVDYEENISQDN